MSNVINYIICAAGRGDRFKSLLPHLSKPEIKLKNKSLLYWSMKSLPLKKNDRVIFIVQEKDQLESKLKEELSEFFYVDQVWITLDYYTKGQLDTALIGVKKAGDNEQICIFNADTFFISNSLASMLEENKYDGIIPCSPEPGDCWSFAEADAAGKISRVTEKDRISDNASVGFYHFKNKELINKYSETYMKENNEYNRENYIAPLYNYLIKDGFNIQLDVVNDFYPMGTPSQITDYWNVSDTEVKKENRQKTGTLVVDLDNTITVEESKTPYPEKRPNTQLIEKLHEYKKQGFEIIIHTARRMRTHRGDEAKVIGEIGKITTDWLEKHNVPYDGIKYAKPFAENGFYIDDKAIRPKEFLDLSIEEIKGLIV